MAVTVLEHPDSKNNVSPYSCIDFRTNWMVPVTYFLCGRMEVRHLLLLDIFKNRIWGAWEKGVIREKDPTEISAGHHFSSCQSRNNKQSIYILLYFKPLFTLS